MAVYDPTKIKPAGDQGISSLSINKSALTNNASPFDLGSAYDNNIKMKYRQQGINAFKPPEEFKMDLASIQSDPTYQAAMESARQATQVAEGNISSALNRRGIMDSTITANAASNAAQQEYGRVNRELLPKLIEDQYKRYMDQNNMNRQYASDMFGVSNMYDNDEQTALNNALNISDRTGSFLHPNAAALERQLVNHKNSTEALWSTMTPEQKAAARAEGDRLRQQLDLMGVDSSLFGADVASGVAKGNMGRSGTQTLAGKASDLANKQANWGAYMDMVGQTQNLGQGPQNNWGNLTNNAGTGQNTFSGNVTMAQLTGYLPDGSPTSAQQQQQLANEWTVADQTGKITPTLAQMYGIPEGTPTRAAMEFAQQIAISRQNANTSAYSAQTSRMNANNSQLMDIWKATGVAPAGINGVSQGTPYASGSGSSAYTGGVLSNFDMPRSSDTMETWLINNRPGGKKIQGPPQADETQWFEMQILNNPNLSDKDITKLYNRFGIPLPQ